MNTNRCACPAVQPAVSPQSAAFSLQINDPPPCATLARLQEIAGTAKPDCCVLVQINDHAPLQAVANAAGQWLVENPYSLANGSHSICAKDGCGEPVCSSFCLNKSALRPPVWICSPAYGSTIDGVGVIVTGTAAPFATVTVCLSGHGCLSTGTGPDGRFRVHFCNILENGAYTIRAFQNDEPGTCAPVSCTIFTVNSALALPPPLILSPANGSIISTPQVTIFGTAGYGNVVTACLSGHCCQSTSVLPNGTYSLLFSDIPDGDYTIRATQCDEYGAKSPAAHSTFTLYTPMSV